MEAAGPSKDEEPRRSTRERKPVVMHVATSSKGKNVKWTKGEKVQLLAGLKKVGEDFEALSSTFIPSKKPYQISYFVNCMKDKVPEYLKSNEPDQLDYWTQKCKESTGRTMRHKFDAIPISILLIILFEKEQCLQDDVDIKSIYEYLFAEIAELPRPRLSLAAKSLLNRILQGHHSRMAGLNPGLLQLLYRCPNPEEWPFSSGILNPFKFPEVLLDLPPDSSVEG